LLESNIVNSILLPLSLVNTTEHTRSYLASHNFIIRLFIFFSNFIASQYSSSLTSPFHFTITYIIFYCRKFIRIALLSISLNLSKSLFYILTKLIFSLVKYRFLYFSGNFFLNFNMQFYIEILLTVENPFDSSNWFHSKNYPFIGYIGLL
jgi:hypothetical protein